MFNWSQENLILIYSLKITRLLQRTSEFASFQLGDVPLTVLEQRLFVLN